MNKKKSIVIILGLVMVLGLGIAYFLVSDNTKSQPNNEYVTVTYKKASVGSIVIAELTKDGGEKYPKAKNYSIYSENGVKELSVLPVKIGDETTVLPKTSAGKNIMVFLYDEDGNLIIKLESKIIK